MFDLGFEWMHIPLIPSTADAPEYGAQQQVSLQICGDDTAHPGAWRKFRETAGCASDQLHDIEPWWAPGTTVTLVGTAASTSPRGIHSVGGNPVEYDCEGSPDGTCGCGAHAMRCHPDFQRYAGNEDYLPFNEHGQRRQLAEEPARLFAHLAWFDQPLDELILGHISVGNTQFDPRVDVGPVAGIPAAGVLTSLAFLDGYPRERLRAARALEVFACEQLDPPQGLTFNEYRRDPASEGSCQHCHRRIDPAAIHFKRWAKRGNALEGFGASYLMPGVGTKWHFPTSWRTGAYPYGGEPFAQWNRWYTADTRLTPVTQAEIDADPEVVFIDFLPPDQTLLGQVSDGTIGPLGFAKLVVASGAFDRCVVRQLHKQIVGRDIDPTTEAGYLDALTARFVDDGKKVRPFIKHLTTSASFQRGL